MESIRLSHDTYMHVYLHELEPSLEERFSSADDSSSNYGMIDFKKSAKILIDAMDDNWCVALLEALKEECESRITNHWKEFNPKKLKKMEKEIINLTEEELEDFDFTGGLIWELRDEVYNFVEKIDVPNGDDGEVWETVVQRKSDEKYFMWDCWRTSYEYIMSGGNNCMQEVFPKTITKTIYE